MKYVVKQKLPRNPLKAAERQPQSKTLRVHDNGRVSAGSAPLLAGPNLLSLASMLLSEKQAKVICDKFLSYTSADDAQVTVGAEDYSHLRFAANSFTTNGRRQQVSAGITVWIDKKRGSATATDFEAASLKSAVDQAAQLALMSPVDKEYIPTLVPQKYAPAFGYVDSTVDFSLSDRAKAIDKIIQSCEKEGLIGAAFHHCSGNVSASATKNGNFHYYRSSLASLSVTARTPDGGSSGYFLRNHYDIRKLDTSHIGRQAISKALTSKNPRTLDPGIYSVILEAQAADDLLRLSFDARSAEESRSPYSAPGGKTKLGEHIFDARLNVYSDPSAAELPASPAAQDGIPARKIYFVRNGTLENLEYSRFWAKEKGKEATPGPVNTIIESSSSPATLKEMIGSMQRGLLVSRFWYIRLVDPRTALFTGLTRDGVWYIENGKMSC